jgi:hypothetical protein
MNNFQMASFRFVAVVLGVILLPLLAFADPTATPPVPAQLPAWYLILLDHLVQVVGAMLMIIAVPIVNKLATLLSQKLGVSISADQEKRIGEASVRAVRYAEEWAHSQIKNGKKVDATDKYSKAADFLTSEAKRLNLENMASDKVAGLILSALRLERNALLTPNSSLPQGSPSVPASVPPTETAPQ